MSLQTRLSALITAIKGDFDGLDTRLTALEGAGGSAKAYASFFLDTGGITGIAGTAVTLNIDQTAINSDTGVFSIASNEITIDRAGDYRISADAYINNSSTSRTEYSIWLELDGVEVNGTRSAVYQRGYDSGQSSSINTILSVTAGQTLRMRIQRTDGGSTAGYQDNDGTRITLQEL